MFTNCCLLKAHRCTSIYSRESCGVSVKSRPIYAMYTQEGPSVVDLSFPYVPTKHTFLRLCVLFKLTPAIWHEASVTTDSLAAVFAQDRLCDWLLLQSRRAFVNTSRVHDWRRRMMVGFGIRCVKRSARGNGKNLRKVF